MMPKRFVVNLDQNTRGSFGLESRRLPAGWKVGVQTPLELTRYLFVDWLNNFAGFNSWLFPFMPKWLVS